MVAGLRAESSCEDRQGQGFCCWNYSISNQNKRFNFTPLASDFLQMTRLVKAFYSKGSMYNKVIFNDKNYNRIIIDTWNFT